MSYNKNIHSHASCVISVTILLQGPDFISEDGCDSEAANIDSDPEWQDLDESLRANEEQDQATLIQVSHRVH